MKFILASLFALLMLSGVAQAVQCPTFPITLTNNTTADASQVMNDLQYLQNCPALGTNPYFTGNVGIGTSNPAYSLDVRGNMMVRPASGTASLQLQDGAPTTTGTLSHSSSLFKISDNANPVEIDANTNGGNAGQLYLATNGSVGIGTRSIESGLLDIYSGTTMPAMTIHGTSGYAVAMKLINDAYSPGTNWLLANDSQGGFTLQQNGVDSFYMNRSGTSYALFYGTIYDSDGAIHTYSDRRLKTNIVSIGGGDALDRITRLNPVTYQWANPSGHDKISNTGGFVAQEIGQVMPNMVNQIECHKKDCDLVGGGKVYTVGLTPEFFAYLTKAVQELKARSDRDEQEISQLKAQLEALGK